MQARSRSRRVTVVGGGVTGLMAARRLAQGGLAVTVVEAHETLGGQIRTIDLHGRPVDIGAEALHLGAPHVRAVVDELDLTGEVVGSRAGQSLLWTGRELRRLPAGVTPSGPTQLGPVLTSRIMSLRGLGRAGLEPFAARLRRPLAEGEDISVGEFVTSRFGSEVTERFIDPLLGSLHSGDVHQLSLRACAPQLVPAAASRRSMLRRSAPRPAAPRPGTPAAAPLPMFASFEGGLRVLVDRLVEGLPVDVRTGTRVLSVTPVVGGQELLLDTGEVLESDAVVLALPAHAAATLVQAHAPDAARVLADAEVARVATVIVGLDRSAVAEAPLFEGTGLLLRSTSGTLLKAMTNLSRKWPQHEDSDLLLLRLSAGRSGEDLVAQHDDTELVARLTRELGEIAGVPVNPALAHVHRWNAGVPQLRVGHLRRLDHIRADLEVRLPGVVVAGSSYDGVGLVACLAAGAAAAASATARLDLEQVSA